MNEIKFNYINTLFISRSYYNYIVSFIGLFEQDIKKVIINFILSLLRMIVIVVSSLFYNIALFYLINYVIYKKLLFLKIGAVINSLVNNQDFWKYGGLRAFLSITYLLMLITSFGLVAFFFITIKILYLN